MVGSRHVALGVEAYRRARVMLIGRSERVQFDADA
jgi:hypothetical protein